MLVGICDFPSNYLFPPLGYGGIERWLWACAVGARRAGADVHLIGPAWRRELADTWTIRTPRLEAIAPNSLAARELRATKYDLLIAGHEYPSRQAWRDVADTLSTQIATFQHNPDFTHTDEAFDGRMSRLYCYSPEMVARYAAHNPIQTLSVQFGFHESEPAPRAGRDLVWVGRIDRDKAPHLAIMAAALLGRTIDIVGPIFDDDYVEHHAALFRADHVRMVGELGGAAKTDAFARAATYVYTCSRTYIEAGVATLGESMRTGTPIAALTWRTGTCADAALCPDTGSIALTDPDADDDQAARRLADAITSAASLKPTAVQAIGLTRFDPAQHFTTLANL
ncbi:glycosyltransferase [Nocardia camponoti]|uniref:Glycosyltransferase n=1 Tax=Nocardia camponoti TaxID=1616106 RepID=A0A917V7C1_9NOCA|nr:glycosyltransferase [Nocardia camponoti]GGK48533.1 hypothetical protein GCM10011591_19910 [Nocardia camponoti]